MNVTTTLIAGLMITVTAAVAAKECIPDLAAVHDSCQVQVRYTDKLQRRLSDTLPEEHIKNTQTEQCKGPAGGKVQSNPTIKTLPDMTVMTSMLIGLSSLSLLPWVLSSAKLVRKRLMSKTRNANGVALLANEPNDHSPHLLKASSKSNHPKGSSEMTPHLDGETSEPRHNF